MLKKTLSSLAIATLAISAHAADVLKVAATAVPEGTMMAGPAGCCLSQYHSTAYVAEAETIAFSSR